MSDARNERRRGRIEAHHDDRDRGFTLPELLVSVMIMGILATSIAMAFTVVLRTADNTEGRLNVARSEQDLAFWVPPDLASAEIVVTDPAAAPCVSTTTISGPPTGDTCPDGFEVDGSNALMLTWTTKGSDGVNTIDITTNVSYRYTLVDGEYQLVRLECISEGGSAPSCERNIVLRELLPPPAGETYSPGVTIPHWVIEVTEPLAPDAIDDSQTSVDNSFVKDANRVVVTINGGGDAAGAGGGINQISITAGGTNRTEIDATSVTGAPTFTEARSRCGGPLTLVIDESNSIGTTNVEQVKTAVRNFIDTFAGTPVELQVIRFETEADLLGDTGWHRYFDMTNEADVATIRAAVDDLKGDWPYPAGGTNWEDAVFRTFLDADGTTADVIPNTVVFFTDGVPTFNRLVHRDTDGDLPSYPEPLPDPWPEATGSGYNQESFNRADYIAGQFRSSVRLVGVGVGSGIGQSSEWLESPASGYHYEYERGSHRYARVFRYVWNGYYYEKVYNGPYTHYEWTTADDYLANNTTPGTDYSDGYWDPYGYKLYSSPYLDWEPVASWDGYSSGYRSVKVYSEPYDYFDDFVSSSVSNRTILARLIAGNDFGVEAILENGQYTNASEADMFTVPDWSKMSDALQAIALGECGGTITLQTRVDGATPAPDPFTYQNTEVLDSSGVDLGIEPTVVTTSQRFTTGTFDFTIPNGQYVTVELQPQNLSELSIYEPSPDAWSCRSRGIDHPFTEISIDESDFTGIRVDLASNEALSCTMSVTIP